MVKVKKLLYLLLISFCLLFSGSSIVKGENITDDEFDILNNAITFLENNSYSANQTYTYRGNGSACYNGGGCASAGQTYHFVMEHKKEGNKTHTIYTKNTENKIQEYYIENIDNKKNEYAKINDVWDKADSATIHTFKGRFNTFDFFKFSLNKEFFTKQENTYYGKLYLINNEFRKNHLSDDTQIKSTVNFTTFNIRIEDGNILEINISYRIEVTEKQNGGSMKYSYSYDILTTYSNHDKTIIDTVIK